VQTLLEKLIAVRRRDYDANFCHVEHDLKCDGPPTAVIRLHFVKADAAGEPRFRELARIMATYITHFCLKAERRADLDPVEHNEMFMRARDLFRKNKNSGQVGELLIYFLLETVLKAPQAYQKMRMTTNPTEERKGSDGVHLRWDPSDKVLEIIFAESKIWQSYSNAVADAFKSIEEFHDSETKSHEIHAFTAGFSELTQDLQERLVSYLEGDNTSNCRQVQACLIGFDWSEYACLSDARRKKFIEEFEIRYRKWAEGKRASLNSKLGGLKHKHLRFEFFMLPFRDVDDFRELFLQALTGAK
jgi:hypothetical protein